MGDETLTHRAVERYLTLPLGAIVAVATLADVVSTAWLDTNPGRRLMAELGLELTKNEQAFGDYTPGRWAWVLADVKRIPEPIPCRGALGLWDVAPEIAPRLVARAALSAPGQPEGGDD